MTSETLVISAHWGENPLKHFNFTKRAIEWADTIGPKVREALRAAAPVAADDGHPGRLRDSIRYSRSLTAGAGLAIEWTANTPYAPYPIFGTAPHDIHPRATRALHFTDARGEEVFARFVHHRGSKANDFGGRVRSAMEPDIIAAFNSSVTKGL